MKENNLNILKRHKLWTEKKRCTTFLDQLLQHKTPIQLKLVYKVNVILVKILNGFFLDLHKLFLTFKWEIYKKRKPPPKYNQN